AVKAHILTHLLRPIPPPPTTSPLSLHDALPIFQGAKLIGTLPDVPKYTSSQATNGTGTLDLANMEWDTYAFTLTDAGYYLAGAIDRKSTRLNSSHEKISYAVFCLENKNNHKSND